MTNRPRGPPRRGYSMPVRARWYGISDRPKPAANPTACGTSTAPSGFPPGRTKLTTPPIRPPSPLSTATSRTFATSCVSEVLDVAVESGEGGRIGGVVSFVRPGGKPDGAVEVPQAVGFAAGFGRSEIPYHRARTGIEYPRRGGPRGLFVILPTALVAVAQAVGPRFGADGRQFELLWRAQHESADTVFLWPEIVDIDKGRCLGCLDLRHGQKNCEEHGSHNGARSKGFLQSTASRRPCPARPEGAQLSRTLVEGGQSRDLLPQNQRVDVVRPLVGVHRFEVCEMPHRLILRQNSVRAEQAAGLAGDVGGHAHVVALGEADLLGRGFAVVLETT